MRFITRVRDVLAEVWRAWQRDDATGRAAAVAFFATFSLAPLLLLSFSAVGALFSRESARYALVMIFVGAAALLAGAELTDVLGRDDAEFKARRQEGQKQA